MLPPKLALVYRLSAVQRIAAAVASYERNFLKNDWRFAGDEVITGGVALDLLWVVPGGSYVSDEVKSGLSAVLRMPQYERQCRAQLSAGIERYGDQFAGVRLLLLADNREYWFGVRGRARV